MTNIDYRQQPQRYRIGRGEQGVLKVEPYKSELLPHWRFKTPELARESADKIYTMFETYKVQGDFVILHAATGGIVVTGTAMPIRS